MVAPVSNAQGDIQDAHTGTDDVLADTGLADDGGGASLETGQPTPDGGEPQPGGEGGDPQAGAVDPLKGTPFKDVGAAVEAYKNIQRLVAAKDQRLQQLEGILSQLVQQGVIGGPGKKEPDKPAEAFNPQAWFQNFALDPVSAIQGIVNQIVKEQLDTNVAPKLSGIEANVSQYQIDREVSDFISRNPDVTEKDEQEILEVLKANPWMQSAPNKLDIAWDRIQAQRAREERRKGRQVEAVKDAKAAAGVGGKPAVVAQEGGDEFDAVLASDKELRKQYGR